MPAHVSTCLRLLSRFPRKPSRPARSSDAQGDMPRKQTNGPDRRFDYHNDHPHACPPLARGWLDAETIPEPGVG